MQKPVAVLVLCTAVAASAQAQRSWQAEVGIQGGWTRVAFAGSGAGPTDVFSVPGFNLGTLVPTAPGYFMVIPTSQKVAVETDVSASQFSTGATVTALNLGVRGNYALTRSLYAAGGGTLIYINGLANETQLGLQAAVGYRQRLSGGLNGRVEVQTTFLRRASNAPPMDTYSVLLGVSTVTGRSPGNTRSATPERPRWAWTPGLGVAGGYANVHLIGTGSVTVLALPGYGGAFGNTLRSLVPAIGAVTLPPTLFLVIPLAGRVAIEPGVDIHRIQGNGETSFSGNLSARLDVAVHGGWYGAAGGNLQYLKSTGISAVTRPGVNLAWGYRFPLTVAVSGRVELNYTMFPHNLTLGFDPTNVLGLMMGVTMPVK